MAAEAVLHTGAYVRARVWISNPSYTQVFEYAQAFGF